MPALGQGGETNVVPALGRGRTVGGGRSWVVSALGRGGQSWVVSALGRGRRDQSYPP
ncbi:hypothetical protein F2Q70_00013842 [Brassica cretica]|uniref:Uncharacterized protein n=1 Tax=Brassica cretica TaxID=69181 RepID=A0A8S9LSL4_BRACR|nr:hypothetical protein F2Q70_00013842 [Brassica cretica]